MTHAHGTAAGAHRGRLVAVLLLTVGVGVAEVVGGLLSGSLALLADAGHMATDAVGVTTALVAVTLAQRPAGDRRTFGLQRVEILAAAANAVLLIVLAGYVVVGAVRRIADPPQVEAGLMLVVALLGLAANGVALVLLRRGQADSLNVRGAYLEVVGDLLGSLGVVVAAATIALTGWYGADVVASLVVGVLIVPRAWSLLRDAVDVLLEAAPRHVDPRQVREHVLAVPGVIDVHDVHAWTITSGVPVVSAHVVVDDDTAAGDHTGVLDRLGECLAGHFDVEHCTFQVEPARHRDHEPVLHA